VTIGPGSVSEDGTVVQSDPGVGVVKGGWHCGGQPDDQGDSESITASISAPSKISTKEGDPPISISASGSPGEGTAWGAGVCSGGGLSCPIGGTKCEGSLEAGPSRKVKIAVVHYMLEEPGDYATDEKEVVICQTPFESETHEDFTIPPTSPFDANESAVLEAGEIGSIVKVAKNLIAALQQVNGFLSFMNSTSPGSCQTQGFDPKLKASIDIVTSCCADCPTKTGTKSEATMTLSSGSAGGSCSFTHPVIAGISGIVDLANELLEKAGSQQELNFEAGVQASLTIDASGSARASHDTCTGKASLTGGADATLTADIGGVLDVQAAGVHIHSFVGGKITAKATVDVTETQVCTSACHSGLELEATFSFNFGTFISLNESKSYPISCPLVIEPSPNCSAPFAAVSGGNAACNESACDAAVGEPFDSHPPKPSGGDGGGGGGGGGGACGGGGASCDVSDEPDGCTSDFECVDTVECTADACVDGFCVNIPVEDKPCESGIPGFAGCCNASGGCVPCP